MEILRAVAGAVLQLGMENDVERLIGAEQQLRTSTAQSLVRHRTTDQA